MKLEASLQVPTARDHDAGLDDGSRYTLRLQFRKNFVIWAFGLNDFELFGRLKVRNP